MSETAERDPTLTRQGFLKSKHITHEAAEQIIDLIADGMREGTACRKHGTSYTQFLRRVKGTDLEPLLRAAEKRRKASVQSDDA